MTITMDRLDTSLDPHFTPRTSNDATKTSHIVKVPSGESDQTPQAYVLRARIMGFPVTALCGYRWVPSQNPQELPVCAKCLRIYNSTGYAGGEGEDLPDA